MGLLRRFSTQPPDSSGDTMIESIIRNLNNVLNSRRDYGSFLDDFGIDDLSHCTSRDALTTLLIDRVSACIERYEPRVELLELEPAPDSGAMRVSLIPYRHAIASAASV